PELPVEPPLLAAEHLRHVRILLLRHNGRPGGELVIEFHEAELAAGPEREIGGQPREVHAEDGGGGEELDEVIAVADRVQAVGGGRGEAEIAGEGRAVDGEGGAGRGGGG